jgi:WD40 repeat protein
MTARHLGSLLLLSVTTTAVLGADDPLPPYARARLGTVRFRHGIDIRGVTFTPDGQTILSLGQDDRLRVWNAETGQHLRDVEGGEFLSRDGRIVTAIHTDRMSFIDLLSGKQLGTIPFENHSRGRPTISPDGKVAALGGEERDNERKPFVQLWEVPGGKERDKLTPSKAWMDKRDRGRSCDFSHLVFSPNGRHLAAVGNFHGAHSWGACVWDVATAKEMPILERFLALRGVPTFSTDGKLLAAPCEEWEPGFVRSVRIWDVATGKRLRDLDTGRGFGQSIPLMFSPDGKRLAAWGDDIALHIWDIATGKALPAPDLSNMLRRGVHATFSPDGKLLAAAVDRGPFRLFDVETGKVVRQLGSDLALGEQGHGRDQPALLQPGRLGASMAFSPDGKVLAAAGGGGVIRRWDVASGKELRPDGGGHEGYVFGLAIAPDGKRIASAGGDNTVRLWNLNTSREERSWAGPVEKENEYTGLRSAVFTAAFNLDGKQLATGWRDGRVQKWDIASGAEVGQFAAHNYNLRSLVFLPDDRLISTGLHDQRVSLWRANGEKLRDLLGQPAEEARSRAPVRSATAVSPSGRLLAVIGSKPDLSPNLQLWELTSGQLRREISLPRHLQVESTPLDHAVRDYWQAIRDQTICFAPDERTLAWSHHNQVTLWDVARGKELRQFGGQHAPVYDVAFTPDGKLLAAASSDGTVRLWDVATATLRAELIGHHGGVFCVAFTPDGRSLVSGGSDSSLLVWDLSRILTDAAKAPAETKANALWEQLADPDARRAGQALDHLLAAPQQTVMLLREKLRPAAAEEVERARRLLKDLDSDQFDRRKTAESELEKLIDVAEPLLRERLKNNPPLELRQRIERVLQTTGGCLLDPQRLRTLRAVELLEQIGTAEARQLLEALAGGAPEARVTQEARATLKRLGEPARP